MSGEVGDARKRLAVLAALTGQACAHHPTLYRTGRHGCWGFCLCGWKSDLYSNVLSVHLAFGQHLVESEPST